MDEIECLNCGWVGTPEELHSETSDPNDRDFVCCPRCGDKEFEDIRDNEEEE